MPKFVKVRNTETGDVNTVSEDWLSRWPDDPYEPITDGDPGFDPAVADDVAAEILADIEASETSEEPKRRQAAKRK